MQVFNRGAMAGLRSKLEDRALQERVAAGLNAAQRAQINRMRRNKRHAGKDYYKTLGLERGANEVEIRRAYRAEALAWHPDKHGGDSRVGAEARFKEVQRLVHSVQFFRKP